MRYTRLAAAAAAATMIVGTGALVAPANAAHSNPAPAATRTVISGTTTVTTAPGIANALLGKGLVVLATAPGSTNVTGALSNPRLNISFPVTGAGKTVDHKGTLIFLNPSKGKSVTLGDLKIDLKAKTISGKLNGGGYAPALKIDTSKAKVTTTVNRARTVTVTRYTNVGVSLNTAIDVAGVLNGALETDVFTPGLKVGSAAVTVIATRVPVRR
jgi:hypothetical protein